MTKVNPADPRLVQVSTLARRLREARSTLYAELELQVLLRLQQQEDALKQAIVNARTEGLPVTAIARAYTGPGKTPNRNKITAILRENLSPEVIILSDTVITWDPRTVQGPEGPRTVYDILVQAVDYGPDDLTGRFRFRVVGDDIEAFDDNEEVWSDFDALHLWVAENPRPA